MKTVLLGQTIGQLASVLASVRVPGLTSAPHHYGRSRYPAGWARIGKGRYMPHQGPREIARRQRQAARRAAKAGGAK